MIEDTTQAPLVPLAGLAEREASSADAELNEMVKAGVHLGHAKSKNHPSMQDFIFGVRNTISILDLTKTKEKLAGALNFLKSIAERGGIVLLAGTRPAARKIIQEVARSAGMPFFTERWIGGTLTNFKTISKRIEYFKKLKNDLSIGALQKYTKKERLDIEREIKRFEELLGGLQGLERLPDLLLVIDPVLHITAVREARKLKIPIVSLVNTDADPDFIDYPVPGNTTARKSIDWFLLKVEEALRQAKSEAVATKGTDVSPHEKQESV